MTMLLDQESCENKFGKHVLTPKLAFRILRLKSLSHVATI